MKTILVLHKYERPLTEELHGGEVRKLDPCLHQYGVTWKRSYLTEDRMQMWCEFEASDAETVRKACRSAEVPVAGAWPVHKFE